MTITQPNLICKTLTVAMAIGLLAACAPSATVPSSSYLSYESQQLQSSLDKQAQTLLALSRQISGIEDQLQRQAREIQQLQQATQQGQPGDQPYQRPQSRDAANGSDQGEGSPTEVYLQAFGDYASGRYLSAIQGFESFLLHFPNNSYASNAQFWLGDCYFTQQQYPTAIQEFNRVLNGYQNAPKNPDALLKIAIAQLQLGETDKARQTIDTLSRRYPKSTATQKAQELALP